MPSLKLRYHCNAFGAFNIEHKITVKSGNSWLYLVMWLKIHIQTLCLSLKQGTHVFILHHYYHIILLFCSKNTILSLLNIHKYSCSIVSITDVYASNISRLALSSTLSFKSWLVVIYLNFLLSIYPILHILLSSKRQQMQFKTPKPFTILLTSLYYLEPFTFTLKRQV
jgi:hypothetical protein